MDGIGLAVTSFRLGHAFIIAPPTMEVSRALAAGCQAGAVLVKRIQGGEHTEHVLILGFVRFALHRIASPIPAKITRVFGKASAKAAAIRTGR